MSPCCPEFSRLLNADAKCSRKKRQQWHFFLQEHMSTVCGCLSNHCIQRNIYIIDGPEMKRLILWIAATDGENPILKLQFRRCLLGCLGRWELTRAPAATVWAYLAPKPHARDLHHPGAANRVQDGPNR